MNDMQRLMDNLLLRLPGAVESVVRLEVFNTIDEFCRETNAWHEHQRVELRKGENRVPMFPSRTAEVVRIMGVFTQGSPINAAYRPNELTTLVTAQSDMEVDVAYSLAPSQKTEYEDPPWIPTDMWERYHLAFLDGTLSRMMSQPAKPYSGMRAAMMHATRFRTAKNDARAEADRAFVYDAQSWSFPYFARGR